MTKDMTARRRPAPWLTLALISLSAGWPGRICWLTNITSFLPGTSSTSTDLTTQIWFDKVPTAFVQLRVTGRRVSTNQEYNGMITVTSAGKVQAALTKLYESTATVALGSTVTQAGLTYTGGQRLKVWADGTTEPTAWTATAIDFSAGRRRRARSDSVPPLPLTNLGHG